MTAVAGGAGLNVAELWPAIFTLALLVVMFLLFVRETYPPEVVAIGGAATLVAIGILPVDDLLGVFSNPAPVTIGAMFILSGALVRAGVLDRVTRHISGEVEERPKRVIGGFAGFTMVSSAFMNNTAVVVMLMPVAINIARTLKVSASLLLIPLSYTAILGGMCTLIGTSTNLIVDGIVQRHGMESFSLFEITPVALPIAFAGIAFMTVAARKLLPNRDALVDFLGDRRRMRFFTEVVIPGGSELIGRKVLEVEHFARSDMTVIDVIRGDASLRRRLQDVELAAGDLIVLRTAVDELLSLREDRSLSLAGQLDPIRQKSTQTVEALIAPDCRMVGRVLGDLRLRRRYGVYPLAVHRRAERVGAVLDEVRIRVGDTLLLEGAPEDIRRLAAEQNLADLTRPVERPYRRHRAPVIVGILAMVIIGATAGVLPIAALAIIGVALALLTRCIDADEAFEMIDGRLLALIFAMLAIGVALERTGAVELIVDQVAPWLRGAPQPLIVFAVFLLASSLTELVSNNAVAVVVTPIAIGLASELAVDPRPLVVAVMIAASASFATPIGYQTNTLVYAPGGYRFTDYMRLGLAMNLGTALIASLLIPLIWSF